MMVRSPETGSQCAPLFDAEHSAVVPGDPQSSRHEAGAPCPSPTSADASMGAARMDEEKKRAVKRIDFIALALIHGRGFL